jgi:hypothetical protein
MNIITIILLSLAGFFAVLFLIALFIKKEHYVKREILINAPLQKVFDYVRLLKNQDNFNQHAMASPDRERAFKGIDGQAGYIYSWSGDKNAGVGQKEIKNIIENEKIEMEIRFTKPMLAVAQVIMETKAVSGSETLVSWSNRSRLNYPLNIMVPLVEKMLAKDMDKSLLILKEILEK